MMLRCNSEHTISTHARHLAALGPIKAWHEVNTVLHRRLKHRTSEWAVPCESRFPAANLPCTQYRQTSTHWLSFSILDHHTLCKHSNGNSAHSHWKVVGLISLLVVNVALSNCRLLSSFLFIGFQALAVTWWMSNVIGKTTRDVLSHVIGKVQWIASKTTCYPEFEIERAWCNKWNLTVTQLYGSCTGTRSEYNCRRTWVNWAPNYLWSVT